MDLTAIDTAPPVRLPSVQPASDFNRIHDNAMRLVQAISEELPDSILRDNVLADLFSALTTLADAAADQRARSYEAAATSRRARAAKPRTRTSPMNPMNRAINADGSISLLPLVLLILLLPCLQSSAAQVGTYQRHDECGAGGLRDAGGECQDARAVLSQSGTLYWIDQNAGSDSNPGTEDRPWKTLSRSTGPGVLQPGDAVLIRGGVYREEIRPRAGGAPGALITWAAYPGEEVIVSGADVVNRPGIGYTGWELQADSTWRHAWTWAAQAISDTSIFDATRRRELFVDNGQLLRQVGGRARPALDNGEFWVEGSTRAPVAVYLKTFDGTSPNEHTIEVGQRNQLFATYGEDPAQCGSIDQGYYRLIGLKFRHGTSLHQQMVVCSGHAGSRIEEIDASWNNGGGIKLSGRDHVIRGSVANHNGIEGIGGTGCMGCLVEHNTASYNNWKGSPGRGHGGGGKFTRSQHSTFRYNTYVGNDGPGLWLDINNRHNEVYSNVADSNLAQGLFVELRSNNNRVYNNVVTRTRYFSPEWTGIGIVISTSDSNLVAYNTAVLNDGAGIRVAGDNRDDATHATVYNNLLLANLQAEDDVRENLREMMVLGNGPPNGRTGWDRVRTHRIDGNAYSYRTGPVGSSGWRAVFMLGPPCDGCKTLYTNDLGAWQQALGFDRAGLIADLTLPTLLDVTEPTKGWQLAAGSQYIGRAVRLPGDVPPILFDFYGTARPDSGASIGAFQPEPASEPGTEPVPTPVPDPAPDSTIVPVVVVLSGEISPIKAAIQVHGRAGLRLSLDLPEVSTTDIERLVALREKRIRITIEEAP